MSNANKYSGGTDSTELGPAARDEDPFDDEDVSSILDDAWDKLH